MIWYLKLTSLIKKKQKNVSGLTQSYQLSNSNFLLQPILESTEYKENLGMWQDCDGNGTKYLNIHTWFLE